MKVVVIGAAGHIGTYLIPMLYEAGYETIAITRTMSTPYEPNPAWDKVQRVLLDRKDETFIDKLKEMEPDVIVDLVNFNVEHTKLIVENFKGTKLSHYLYCSSCWSHGIAKVLPFDADDEHKEPIDPYGKDKFASEMYLKTQFRENGFPATMILPGQISGPGWTIINPWGNLSLKVVQDIADGKEIALPNFGQEVLHHVHGADVAQLFFCAITHRSAALGHCFNAQAAEHITLIGYATHLFELFHHTPAIRLVPWAEWCTIEGNADECDMSRRHLVRSGTFSIAKEQALLGYKPKYTILETIDLAIQSYVKRGVITPH